MANQWLRANLAAARWPLTTELAGRSVITHGADMTYDPSVVTTSDDKDRGLPQVIYLHNCMPTNSGFQSIGYTQEIPNIPAYTDFDSIFPITTSNLVRCLFVPASGQNYIYNYTTGYWAPTSSFLPGTVNSSTLVTTAFLKNQTYIYYDTVGAFTYDDVGLVLVPVALAGLVISAIHGLCAANGYLITWNDTNIAWSSLTTPTDFTPSLISGAGGGAIQEAKGKILFCLPIAGGFMIYCEQNVVSARYSSNIQFPFIFVEVAGSSGVTSPGMVSWQANAAEHYSWTGAGLQKIDKNSVIQVFNEQSDFLSGLIFEDFDELTLQFTTTYLLAPLNVRLTYISNRYVVISYGITAGIFTHALVYDTAYLRWGKLKIPHVDCFQWNFPDSISVSVPTVSRKQVAFVGNDGTVNVVDFDFSEATANGVCVLGKFQLNRNRLIVHQESHVETARTAVNEFNFYLLPSLLGKDFGPVVTPKRILHTDKLSVYGRRLTVTNFCSLFMGSFDLTSYIINVSLGGQE